MKIFFSSKISSILAITKYNIMQYLHFVTDANGEQLESLYSATETPKFSMEALAKLKNGEYKVWNRDTNKIKILWTTSL